MKGPKRSASVDSTQRQHINSARRYRTTSQWPANRSSIDFLQYCRCVFVYWLRWRHPVDVVPFSEFRLFKFKVNFPMMMNKETLVQVDAIGLSVCVSLWNLPRLLFICDCTSKMGSLPSSRVDQISGWNWGRLLSLVWYSSEVSRKRADFLFCLFSSSFKKYFLSSTMTSLSSSLIRQRQPLPLSSIWPLIAFLSHSRLDWRVESHTFRPLARRHHLQLTTTVRAV